MDMSSSYCAHMAVHSCVANRDGSYITLLSMTCLHCQQLHKDIRASAQHPSTKTPCVVDLIVEAHCSKLDIMAEVQFIEPPPAFQASMSEDLLARADIELVVEGETLPCHYSVLALQSKVFDQILADTLPSPRTEGAAAVQCSTSYIIAIAWGVRHHIYSSRCACRGAAGQAALLRCW